MIDEALDLNDIRDIRDQDKRTSMDENSAFQYAGSKFLKGKKYSQARRRLHSLEGEPGGLHEDEEQALL